MKRMILCFFCLAFGVALFFSGCSKSGSATPVTPRDTVVIPPVDTTHVPAGQIVVRTLAIYAIAGNYIADDSTIYRLDMSGQPGNAMNLFPMYGNTITTEIVNFSNYVREITVDSLAQFTLGNVKNGYTVVPADSANYFCVKVRGFDKTKTGFNQLNLILCKWVVGSGIMSFASPHPSRIDRDFILRQCATNRYGIGHLAVDGVQYY